MSFRLEVKKEATFEDRRELFDLLEGYNALHAGPEPETPLAVVLKDDSGQLIGGLWGLTYYRWLFIELLFVPEEMRHRGIGTQLMREAEAEALDRGCHGAWLESFSFQARGFYEKLGYAAFGTIPEYPPGHSRIFMRKWLATAA